MVYHIEVKNTACFDWSGTHKKPVYVIVDEYNQEQYDGTPLVFGDRGEAEKYLKRLNNPTN